MTTHSGPQARATAVNTGRWIAASRALETARPDRLFCDPWAELLAGDSGKATLAASAYNPFLPVRTRYFDDQILRAARPGAQIVLLGAGMDTRAFRMPLPPSCRVFELDYAEAFADKEAVLGTATSRTERLSVPADLSGTWTEPLLGAGLNPRATTIWVAEGLFYYLTVEAAQSLVRTAADLSAQGSIFLADIFGTGLLQLEALAPLVEARMKAERPLPFCTDEPITLFTANGWSDAALTYPGQPEANFGRFTESPPTKRASNLRTYLVTATRT
ncbi:class I SAM-dependent methyltransferase [Paenarthrobacter nicotinovorans]|uniref:class I SAM-dependent methyltransferase n=1 Tax=Paenarthrobacter nicotinovorans TaxID=29320 RepID=UPI001667DC5E|nr:SAM-dependent methyltransferase [Paenarthrobacter nicotinovorans]MBP2394878.1 methyltransferase (TIGR00027 family) [Paenarthrobacter nicotinovorans]UKE98957.1 SAM-dependent methyltransferase [Paenarthrobacter nicotinovorans]UKF03746.1 SAM-dependent methyltransferase [Paenarthrobacter nicotinovorans]GGV47241.1 S-adenosyl-L-methionine-dependent methyltransferase [Paenarthrobacter nicotinovorans]